MALRDAGWRVVNVACGLGRTEQRARRGEELREACRLAGFELRVAEPPAAISRGDDQAAAAAALLELTRAQVAELEPALVVSPSPHDRHHGHELVARAVREALGGLGDGAPRWWMWSLWASLPLPTIGARFGDDRLAEVLAALAGHRGELERNDYRRLVRARAEANASLGPELLFGFGTTERAESPYVELLTEVVRRGGRWLLGHPRWLDPAAPFPEPGELDAGKWLEAPSVAERFDPPRG